MFTSVRAGVAAAFVALAVFPALGADKAFKRSDLDQAAIKLEAQIKSDAGTVTKPAATLRRDADAAFQKNDLRAGMTVLGQLVSVAPTDAVNWLRLARTILQIRPRDEFPTPRFRATLPPFVGAAVALVVYLAVA